jgi:hypothetical protein
VSQAEATELQDAVEYL